MFFGPIFGIIKSVTSKSPFIRPFLFLFQVKKEAGGRLPEKENGRFNMAFKFTRKKKSIIPKTQKEREALAARREARRAARRDPDSRFNVAVPYVLICLAIFTGFCLYSAEGGLLGDGIRYLFFGLFSYLAYGLPFVMILLGIFWRRSVEKGNIATHLLLLSAAILMLLSLLYVLTLPRDILLGVIPKEEVPLNAGQYFESPVCRGGGLFGALIGWVLFRLVGPVGTILLTALAVLLYGIFGFGFSPDEILREGMRAIRRGIGRAAERRQSRKEAKKAPLTEEPPQPTPAAATTLGDEKTAEEKHERAAALFEAVKEEPTQSPAAESRHRRFADIFKEAGGTSESHSAESLSPLPSEEELREYKEKKIREKLRNRERIVSYPVSDLLGTQRDAELSSAPVDTPTEGEPVFTPKAPESELPFRGVEDFRRVTISEPVCVKSAAQRQDEANALAREEIRQERTPTEVPPIPVSEESPIPVSEAIPERILPLTEEASCAPGDFAKPPEREPDREPPSPKPTKAAEPTPYTFPPISLLQVPTLEPEGNLQEEIQRNSDTLVQVLKSFGIPIRITGYSRGPRITRYEFIQQDGIRVDKVATYANDITQKLSTQGVRIEAPIPNKSTIGVEVPNRKPNLVRIRSLIDSDSFKNAESKTNVAIGCDITGSPILYDIAEAPHMLIAGATGMGKSVCINSILVSLLYKAAPEDVRLILIDPKKVEFNIYSKIPHLLVPVVTDPTKAAGALNWAVAEMERRYDLIEEAGVRNIKHYNRYCEKEGLQKLPKIVIVIDELNDLMMSARKMVEDSICRIAQKARAAGIHLIIGTQRPSVKVITGDIKANIPTRIAFRVNQQVDSRTILDIAGAEKLLPKGDMLFAPQGTPLRVQGAFVDDDEVKEVVTFLRDKVGDAVFDDNILAGIEKEAAKCAQHNDDEEGEGGDVSFDGMMSDPIFRKVLDVAFASGTISTSMLQRRIGIGFGRASRYIDAMYDMGIVGEAQGGSRPREVLIDRAEYERRYGDYSD